MVGARCYILRTLSMALLWLSVGTVLMTPLAANDSIVSVVENEIVEDVLDREEQPLLNSETMFRK